MGDPFIANALEVVHGKAESLVGFVQLVCSESCVPDWLEGWKNSLNFAAIDAITSFVRTCVGGIFDLRTRNGFLYDFGKFADPIIVFVTADIERLVAYQFGRSLENGQERS